jgi:hypothetical protein
MSHLLAELRNGDSTHHYSPFKASAAAGGPKNANNNSDGSSAAANSSSVAPWKLKKHCNRGGQFQNDFGDDEEETKGGGDFAALAGGGEAGDDAALARRYASYLTRLADCYRVGCWPAFDVFSMEYIITPF